MVDRLRYDGPKGQSYSELMSGKRLRANALDLASGMLVTLAGYDEESAWPLIEWTDGSGSARITTIDPVMFAEFFTPVIEEW